MNCCDTFGHCTQGRECPARTGVVTPAQAAHAARMAGEMPVQFVGPEPTAPTRPLDDDGVPLTPGETRQLVLGTMVFLSIFGFVVLFGITYGWGRFARDLVAYFLQ